MITTIAGIPAGYGYFEETSVAGQNVIPEIKEAILSNNQKDWPITIQTVTIQVQTATKVSINDRLPVLVQPNVGLSFDVRGTVYSIAFEDAVQYNIAFSY